MHLCIQCDEFPPAPHGGTGSSYHDLARGLVEIGHQVTVVGCYKPEALKKLSTTPQSGAKAARTPNADAPTGNPHATRSVWSAAASAPLSATAERTDDSSAESEKPNLASPLPGLRVFRLPLAPDWLPYRLRKRYERWRLKRWLVAEHRRQPFDLVESSDYGGWLPYGGPDGVPVVVRIRGSNLFFDHELDRPGDPLEHELEKQTLLRAQHLGSVSRYAAKSTLALCGQPDRACTVIYNGVNTELFAPSERISTDPSLIVFANTINPKKGIEQLLDAMNLVCARNPAARLVVIGQDTQKSRDGRTYVDRLQERVKPEFRARVTFAGRLPREGGLLEYLQRAHLCCYPSHMETFGIAPVEAMSVGKPTIYSRTGPGPEVVEDGVSGLLCDPRDPADIAAKINSILENPALAETLGRNGRARVLAMFEKRTWVKRNVEFFEQVLAGKRGLKLTG